MGGAIGETGQSLVAGGADPDLVAHPVRLQTVEKMGIANAKTSVEGPRINDFDSLILSVGGLREAKEFPRRDSRFPVLFENDILVVVQGLSDIPRSQRATSHHPNDEICKRPQARNIGVETIGSEPVPRRTGSKTMS